MDTFLLGLIIILFGAVFTFAGYQLYRILLPIWGFIAGFSWGAVAVSTGLGEGFLASVTGWVVGIAVGAVLAILAYALYQFGVGLVAGSLAYLAIVSLFSWMGIQPGVLVVTLGIVAALAAAVAAVYFKVPRALLMVLTAMAGSIAMIEGAVVMLGQVPPEALGTNALYLILRNSGWWVAVWAVLTGFGIATQYGISRNMANNWSSSYLPSGSDYWAGAKGGEAQKSQEYKSQDYSSQNPPDQDIDPNDQY